MKKEQRQAVTRRSFVGGALVSTAVLGSGCYGSFGLTDMLYDWNTDVSNNKFVRALVFFALVVIPVYEIFLFIDAVILNTVEFWTGSHPVGGSKTAKLGGGRELTSTHIEGSDVVRHELRADGKVQRVLYSRRVGEDQVELLDEQMQVLTRATVAEGGRVQVQSGSDTLAVLEPAQLSRAASAVQAGESVSESVRAELLAAPKQSDALANALSNRG